MYMQVHFAPLGSGLNTQETLDIYCGAGHQIVQWLGYAACSRFSYKRGDVLGSFVPQAVLNKDGNVLDTDLVLSEAVKDGDEVYVEFSEGPLAYRVRWEGRPRSPPFCWGESGEVVAPHDAWLSDLDLRQEGLAPLAAASVTAAMEGAALANPGGAVAASSPAQVAEAAAHDLQVVKETLVQHAGMLQMLLLYYSCEGSTPLDAMNRMTLPQFKALLQASKVTSSSFPADRLDELFTLVATSEATMDRRQDSQVGVSWLGLADLMVALVHVAHHRYNAEYTGPTTALLSTKLLSLLQECIGVHLLPEVQRRVDKLHSAFTPGALLLLRKGRKLTEQALERCQVKRVKGKELLVEFRHVCRALQAWGLLGRELVLAELAPIAVFAKQTQADPSRYTLHPLPLAMNYDEYERMLAGIAFHLYSLRKKNEAFEEFLGDMLSNVYRRAGVLLEVEAAEGKGPAMGSERSGAWPGPGGGEED